MKDGVDNKASSADAGFGPFVFHDQRPGTADFIRWAEMYPQLAMLALATVLLSGCASPHMTVSPAETPSTLAEEPRNGEILVYVGGNATRKGSLWIPQETTLASLEKLVAEPPEFASRHVRVTRAGPSGGQQLDFRVNKMSRREKEAVKIHHGDVIFFAWDRCFGFAPNQRPGVDAGWALLLASSSAWPRATQADRWAQER